MYSDKILFEDGNILLYKEDGVEINGGILVTIMYLLVYLGEFNY